MNSALKLPVILGSAAVLAVSALLLDQPIPITPEAPPARPTVAPVARANANQPVIQIALLLDTSGSMDGLLDRARSQLWNIVNRFSHAKRDGVAPQLQIALYAYGNADPGANSHEIRQVLPFTTDLDLLSEHLFSLRTSGGDEHCGEVIRDASAQLAWSKDPDTMRLIFIAGNEPFTQGPVDFDDAVRNARERGITVNTIHCGDYEEGVAGKWKDAAVLADGSYMNIDQNQRVVELAAPQDAEIAQLGAELNKTYVAYGAAGRKSQLRQEAQDSNSRGVSIASMVSRSVAKSSRNYSNESWDLVDAVKKNRWTWRPSRPKSCRSRCAGWTPPAARRGWRRASRSGPGSSSASRRSTPSASGSSPRRASSRPPQRRTRWKGPSARSWSARRRSVTSRWSRMPSWPRAECLSWRMTRHPAGNRGCPSLRGL
ncbi:VWA domain-containing protein [Cystobacter fuscus]